ncbi:MAG TPA: M64 family metallopeptidase [Chthoniobacterales bacterium]|nr:M64 family metallopeptidase [Chthoniobacterales bacterium]
MRGRACLPALFALWLSAGFAAGQALGQLRSAGPLENRINIVILSEGYTQQELMSDFPMDAQAAMNGFLNSEPYKEYAPYINVFTIAIASEHSGSDHPSLGQFKNTYFNSTYDSFGQERLLTIPPNDLDGSFANGQGKVDALLAQFIPEYDLVLMIVNDTAYGGSGGPTSIASVHQDAVEVLIHEIGHTFADLADEYEIDAPQITPVEKANVTQQTTRALIKWNIWILPSTPIPTPENGMFNSVIGLFEGANYRPTGWYRPKHECKMNVLNVPFCSPCAEALVLNIYKRIELSDGASPNPGAGVALGNSETKPFSVTPLVPATHTLSFQWFLDNNLVQGATSNVYNLSGSGLALGQHMLRVELRDQSAFVRNDPVNDLTQSISWTVNVNDGTTPPGRLLNIATRMRVQAGDNVIIGGFIITGTDPKNVIIRGIGPSLAQFFAGTLANPRLELLQGSTSLATNDDWKTSQAEVQATGIPPSHDLESAIVRTLAPGAYTAILRGSGAGTGIGVVEVYDLNQAANSKLANIATRGFVETGDNVMIGGLIAGPGGAASIKVVVRAIGPTLANLGVPGALQDPTLELVASNGAVLRSNNNWQDAQKTEIESFNLGPGDIRESALVETIAPGNYTAIVRGAGNTTGVALVEVYNVD